MNYRMLVDALMPLRGEGEARAIARMVMEERFGLSQTDLLLGRDADLSLIEREELEKIASRLVSGEPVQHVLGYAYFCGHRLAVSPDVLIPRPETEELVEWILHSSQSSEVIIDLCTGSGAIAIALSAALPASRVIAIDISEASLEVAHRNVESTKTNVTLLHQDVLDIESSVSSLPMADVIVSNPPYVRRSEADDMESTVLDYEPHLALFVDDADPLCFYRSIAAIASQRLNPGGRVFVEINSYLAQPTMQLFRDEGFNSVELRQDQFGRDRMICANV